MTDPERIIVAISGASGVIYGIEMLKYLSQLSCEVHLIISAAGKRNIQIETDYSVEQVEAIAHVVYDNKDVGAAVASGSFLTAGMMVVPCSIKTLSGIVHSYNDNLLTRAADVTLKERRKLVLMVRETPLHKGHLKMMAEVTDLGALVLPPVPAFYHRPNTIDDIIHQSNGKVLDYFRIEHDLFRRWHGRHS